MMLILTVVLVLGVLSACGTSKKNENSATPSTGHGEHGDHDTKEQPANSLKASFSFASGTVIATENSDLNIQITDSDGNSINEFEWSHEKLMHLIVVSKDLSYFNHTHPDYNTNGNFVVETSFPNGGEYKVFSDFVPKGGASTTLSEWVEVEGEEKEQEPIEADTKLVKFADGKEVELTLSSTTAKDEVTLTFNMVDAQTKKDISDLEQYLGAVGHVVILSDDAEQYLHVHPVDEKATGPKAEFMTSFPKSGIYKIWGQFQHQGQVFTVPFVVDIE
ncbi:hypothetical protein G3352_12215 [Paenibacillus sp. ALJ109b]|nr:hypothetical protein [Paenibacillus sp. ALJ109b]